MYDDTTIGARLRTLRRWRGMTLLELGGQAGLSKSFLSMAERGQRALDRRSHIAALASALRVSETELVGGPHLTEDPVQSGPHAAIPHLRVALQTNSLQRLACDYDALGDRLPPLVDELHTHTAVPRDEAAHVLALNALVDACVAANFLAGNLGYPDLAHVAARRAVEAAAILDAPVTKGKAAFVTVLSMPKVSSWGRSLTAATKAADALEPHASDPTSLQVLGMLTLTASLAAASVNNHTAAADWLDTAADLAGRMPDNPSANWMSFSATNVGVWRVGVGVESGQAGRAVTELAKSVDESKLHDVSTRRSVFVADVGRGLARDRASREEAIRWLRRAEHIAPQRIRNDLRVRETIAVLLSKRSATRAAESYVAWPPEWVSPTDRIPGSRS